MTAFTSSGRRACVACVLVCLLGAVRADASNPGPGAEQARQLLADLRVRFAAGPAKTMGTSTATQGYSEEGWKPLGPSAAVQFDRRGREYVARVEERLANAPRGVDLTMPVSAAGPFRLAEEQGRVEISVRLAGAADVPAETAEGYLMYRRALPGGDLLYRIREDGVEDYLYLRSKPARSQVVYEMRPGRNVSGLRLAEGALEILDGGGAARLRMSPPQLIDAGGARHVARLVLSGCPTAPARLPSGARCSVAVSWEGLPVRYPLLLDPAWTLLGLPLTERWLQTATRIRHGGFGTWSGPESVLVIGGRYCPTLNLADCVDRKSVFAAFLGGGTFGSQPPDLNVGRWGHASVEVPGGKVLVMGGVPDGSQRTAEVLQLADDATWTLTPDMNRARAYHTATVVRVGGEPRVLVAGGHGCEGPVCGPVGPAELYDPGAGTWTLTGALSAPRYNHTATLLPDGRVLVAGGVDASGSLASVEIYDPATGAWTPAAPMNTARHFHTADLISVGGSSRVLVTGGLSCSANCPVLASAELYDPVANTWTPTGSMGTPRWAHTITRLRNCKLLAVAGNGPSAVLNTTEAYDPLKGTFSPSSNINEARSHHSAWTLADGDVLIAAGLGATSPPSGIKSAERFDYCDPSVCNFDVPSCACPSTCPDTDGDGLSDAWETNGIDTDCDGIVDVDLPAMGASPLHKDVFVELDWMEGGDPFHSHKPEASDIAPVVEAFAKAPVSNPDNINGINLHVEFSNAVPEANSLTFDSEPAGPYEVSFESIKAANSDPNRNSAFRYALFGHYCGSGCPGASGIAELLGNDFMVTLGGWVITPERVGGTFMHELGHTLNLAHSGGYSTEFEYSVNYQSVMNYRFQMRGIPPSNRLDYSRQRLPDLDEASLSEPLGIQDGADETTYNCVLGPETPGAGTGKIDWNCNGADEPLATTVAEDINGSGVLDKSNLGWNDWGDPYPGPKKDGRGMRFDYQCSVFAEAGVHPLGSKQKELDLVSALAHGVLYPVLKVDLDVWPGCAPNVLAPGGPGEVPVAVVGSPQLDVSTIDVSKVVFAGASPVASTVGDVNGDGRPDLTLSFPASGLNLTPQSTSAALQGSLFSSQAIFGRADVTITADACAACGGGAGAPTLAVTVSPSTLSPPNHKLVPITVALNASDDCGEPQVSLVSVTSSEPDDAVGEGDGHTTGDIVIGADGQIRLRAERAGGGPGRTYTLTYRAVDGNGNVTTTAATVRVP